MTPAVTIREATADDADGMAPLLAALGYPAEPAVIRDRHAALARVDGPGAVLVAVREGRVLGMATLHATPVLHRETPVGRVTALAVLPDAQGAGVGRRLIAEAERRFSAAGVRRVEITSGLTHRAAYGFYRRLGYEDHGVRFAKTI